MVEHAVGSDVRLECRIKANPLVNHYWMKNDKVIENSLMNMHFVRDPTKVAKYEINIFNQNNKEYLTVSSLVVLLMARNWKRVNLYFRLTLILKSTIWIFIILSKLFEKNTNKLNFFELY